MAQQSSQEIQTVVGKWEKEYKPSNLLASQHNIGTVVQWIQQNKGGVYTIQNLNEAVTALGNMLEYAEIQYVDRIVEKIVEVERKPSEKEQARKQREAADNLGLKDYGNRQPRVTDYDKAVTKANKVEREAPIEEVAYNAAQQLSAEAALDRIVTNFSVAGPSGRISHSETSRKREELRAINYVLPNGSKDWVRMANEAANMVRTWDRERERRNSGGGW